jgi:hypothetical protein
MNLFENVAAVRSFVPFWLIPDGPIVEQQARVQHGTTHHTLSAVGPPGSDCPSKGNQFEKASRKFIYFQETSKKPRQTLFPNGGRHAAQPVVGELIGATAPARGSSCPWLANSSDKRSAKRLAIHLASTDPPTTI